MKERNVFYDGLLGWIIVIILAALGMYLSTGCTVNRYYTINVQAKSEPIGHNSIDPGFYYPLTLTQPILTIPERSGVTPYYDGGVNTPGDLRLIDTWRYFDFDTLGNLSNIDTIRFHEN